MAAHAVHNGSPPAPHHVPAVASGAIRGLLTGPLRPITVLGTSADAVWVDAGDDVVVVTTRKAVRLPNGVEVGTDVMPAGVDGPGAVGNGRVRLGPIVADVVRWWVARPALPPATPAGLSTAASGLPSSMPGMSGERLHRALVRRDAALLLEAAGELVGLGEGLTPTGDDYLAASVATCRCLSAAIGDDSTAAMLDEVTAKLDDMASERTTAFSASLLRHGVQGNVAAPVADLLRSLAGLGNVGEARSRLEEVGHTSGAALVAGVGMGVRSVVQGVDG